MERLTNGITKQCIRVDGVYIPYYRYLMGIKVGRKLSSNEAVHHINFNHGDNRIENLELMTISSHATYHGKLKGLGKIRVEFEIEKEILVKFNIKAKENAINKSQWIENKMKEYLKEVRK